MALNNNVTDLNNNVTDYINFFYLDLVYLGEARFGITVQKDNLHSARVTSKEGVKYALNLIEFIVTRTECQDKLTVSGEGRGTKPMDFHKVEALKSMWFSFCCTCAVQRHVNLMVRLNRICQVTLLVMPALQPYYNNTKLWLPIILFYYTYI